MRFGEYTYRQELVDDIRDVQAFISDFPGAWDHIDLAPMSAGELEAVLMSLSEVLYLKLREGEPVKRSASVGPQFHAYRSSISGQYIWERSG